MKNIQSWVDVEALAKRLEMSFIPSICLPNNFSEIDNMPNLNFGEGKTEKSTLYGEQCEACYSLIAINSNGVVYPCQSLINKDMLITNVRKDNWLQELHESNLTKDFLSWSIDKTEKCQDCKLKYPELFTEQQHHLLKSA